MSSIEYLPLNGSSEISGGGNDPPKKPNSEQLRRWWRAAKKLAKRYGVAAGIIVRLVFTLILLGCLDPLSDVAAQMTVLVEAIRQLAASGMPEL